MSALALFIAVISVRDANLRTRNLEVFRCERGIRHQEAVGKHQQLFADRVQSIPALDNICAGHRTGPETVHRGDPEGQVFQRTGEVNPGVAALQCRKGKLIPIQNPCQRIAALGAVYLECLNRSACAGGCLAAILFRYGNA